MRGKLLAAILAAGVAAGPDIREDPPVASRPAAGDVTGQITPAVQVARVFAVCRATGKRYKSDKFDAKTGAFVFKDLPGDATYDVCLVTKDSRRVEGIDLSWHEARMLRLAAIRRRQLALPPERKRKFTRADAKELVRYVKDLKDFMNVRRVLYVAGDGLRATMLVEVMRTRPFHAQRGDEVIWRTELWYFRYRYGGWERAANVERVLERERIPASQWKAITLVYYPQLSAHVDEAGRSEPVKFEIPKTLDGARGRIAGTDPVQKTRPIILGVGKAKDRPRSKPASGKGNDQVQLHGG